MCAFRRVSVRLCSNPPEDEVTNECVIDRRRTAADPSENQTPFGFADFGNEKKRKEPEVKSFNFYDSFYSPFDGGTNIRFERRKSIERRASHPTPHLMYEVRSAFWKKCTQLLPTTKQGIKIRWVRTLKIYIRLSLAFTEPRNYLTEATVRMAAIHHFTSPVLRLTSQHCEFLVPFFKYFLDNFRFTLSVISDIFAKKFQVKRIFMMYTRSIIVKAFQIPWDYPTWGFWRLLVLRLVKFLWLLFNSYAAAFY